ncbi:MAG: aromatic ring-hydroxylating oxygenase subunit alpha, partial [Solirubrobacteraceae bacterium]
MTDVEIEPRVAAAKAGPAELRSADEVVGGAPLLALPKARYSTGWFQVAWSDEVPPGAVKLVQYFGQSIVLWRGDSGQIYALDAYCLHLGGNLGVRGEVKGEDIECPWHGWNWNGKGRNTLIPYSKKQPCKKNLKMRAWPVRDWAGCIIVWHDAAKREPTWEPPELPELERTDFYPIEKCPRRMWKLRAHPQVIVENGADFAHIKKVHGAGRWPDIEQFGFEDHEWSAVVSTSYGAGKKSTRLTPD